MGKLKIWTVGHGTRPVEELASMLEGARIELLIDVRAHPGSRRHPQFNREPLESSLAAHRIGYRWEGKALGGFRKPRESARGARLALMCAERHPSRCHRRLISDWLASRDVEVEHLIDGRRSEPHTLTRGAVIAAGTVTYPGTTQPGLRLGII